MAGVSAAAIVDGELGWTRTWGVRDVGAAEAVGTETLFQAGSVSKVITAVGALRLAEQGPLDLDGPVDVGVVERWRPHVTPRLLLSHLAGLSVWGFPGYQRTEEIPDAQDVIDGKGNTPPVRPEAVPGLLWRYSGGGTTRYSGTCPN